MIELANVSFRYGSSVVPDAARPDPANPSVDGAAGLAGDSPGLGPLVLDHVSLAVGAGEVVVLCGASGCGKTTVTRLVNGLIGTGRQGVREGAVRVDGLDPGVEPTARIARHAGSVFQDPRTQFFTTDVASELAFGCENFALPPAEIRRRVSGVTEDWELEGILGRSVFALSGGQKQRVICAAVDAMDTRALVLDEPSANLDAPATAQLADLIRRWQEQGKAILIAEHRLAYLAPLADRFIRLEAGRVTHRLTATRLRALGPAKLADLGLRPVDGEVSGPDIAPAARLAAPAEDPGSEDAGGQDAGLGGIELRNVSYWRPHRAGRKYGRQVIGIGQLDLRQGQIAALTGPNGAGKTTLLRLIAGVAPGGRGEMRVNGQLWRRRRRLLGVALVGQDVNQQLFADTVRGELTLANRRLSDLEVDAILGSFGLADLGSRHPLALSAGERQRLAIAAAFAQDRPVVALDEPTSGLDLGHMRQVAAGIRQLGAAGRTVLVATHDQELVAACAERVITLQDGLLTS